MNAPSPREGLSHGNAGRWQGAVLATLGVLILLGTSHSLLTSYSYLGDEMFSVVESLVPTREFFRDWILWDVHPPLYQTLLRGWIALFGAGEIATRLLSFLFVILGLVSMAVLTARRPFFFRLVAVSFLASSPALAYYAQETRSYGMMFGLSTLVTLLAMDLREKAGAACTKERWMFGLCALLLSLTHYFGLVWVIFLTLLQLVKPTHPAERLQGLILMPLLFLWPVFHLFLGGVISKTGGNFNQWMAISVPILSTVNRAMVGLLPGLEISRQPPYLLRWLAVILLLLVWSWPLASWKNGVSQISTPAQLSLRHSRLLALLIVLFIALMALIDLHTSLTTSKNFLVLLPALALVLAGFSQALFERLQGWRRLLLFTVLTIWFVLQLNSAAAGVTVKAYPPANFKQLAFAVRSSDLCKEACYADFANTYWTYYFGNINLLPLPQDGSTISSPLLLLRSMDQTSRSMASDHLCFQPHQMVSSPVLLLPPKMVDRRSLAVFGLSACPASVAMPHL